MQINSYDQSTLKYRYIIDLYFEVNNPIHIGYRSEGVLKKILLLNIGGKEIPIIPNSAIKGVMRHTATMLAKKMWGEDSTPIGEAVKLHDKDRHKYEVDEVQYNTIKEQILNSKMFDEGDLEDMDIVELYYSLICPVCRLFGSTYIRSSIKIYDIILGDDFLVNTYTSTSINRKTLTVEEKRLYKIEYLVPKRNKIVKLRMIVDNVAPKTNEARLLAQLLQYIEKIGITVGGAKSIGYGSLTFREADVIVQEFRPMPQSYEEAINNIRLLLFKNVEKYDLSKFLSYLLGSK